MFSLGWGEIFLLVVLALVVVGPKDLPPLLRTLAKMVRQIKDMGQDVRLGVRDMLQTEELESLKKDATALKNFDLDALTTNEIKKDFSQKLPPAETLTEPLNEAAEPPSFTPPEPSYKLEGTPIFADEEKKSEKPKAKKPKIKQPKVSKVNTEGE